jgi:hypothetical protein
MSGGILRLVRKAKAYPGAKAPFVFSAQERPKPEALGYLDANAKANTEILASPE